MQSTNQIIQGDCLKVMKELPDKCVDFIWTDIIYNVGKDYGICKDKMPDDEYLSMVRTVISELKRLSDNICMFIPTKYALQFWNMLGPEYKQIILSYSPEGAIRHGFSNQFSFLLTNVKPKHYCKNVWHNCQMTGLGYFFKEESYGNPGYTSEDITARVIHYFSNEGDLILDPFNGTGTTSVVCKRSGRKYIGIELDQKWIDIAQRRLDAVNLDLFINIT